MKRLFALITFLAFCFGPDFNLYAADSGPDRLVERMGLLVFQIAAIIFAALIGGRIFKKLKLPEVLGEIFAGIIIGPYFLGSISLPGFSHGFFPLSGNFPVSHELYSFATLASIVLLFLVGLETDLEIFLRLSGAGAAVGVGGVVVSFLLGDAAVVWFSRYVFGVRYGFTDPIPLFLGVISTASSVGITARILSEKRKMNSPEGVTILSGAIIDDVLGIILLAVVIGVAKSGNVQWGRIAAVSTRAILVWLGFMALGLAFARRISSYLKQLKDRNTIAVMSFALALLLAGIFEKSGLAMIIGAYIMGLTFSKTDLAYLIRENFSNFYRFFVPIFFCVMGMLVNIKGLFSGRIILFALVYSALAVLAKFIGCSLPALFFDFNRRGALRLGMGMVPRGEVALIVAGIGLSTGLLAHDAFNIAVAMTFVTTVITPPILSRMLGTPGPVLRKEKQLKARRRHISFSMPNPETAELILSKILAALRNEGFYIHLLDYHDQLYQLRKEGTFITLRYSPKDISFDCREEDVLFIHTLFYEVLASLERTMKQLQRLTDREKIGWAILADHTEPSSKLDEKEKARLARLFKPQGVKYDLKAATKRGIIEELVGLLIDSGQLAQKDYGEAVGALLDRENDISTGLQDGIAFPHARVEFVDRMITALGVRKDGVEFNSLDKQPARIFVVTLIPQQAPEPYLKFIATLSLVLSEEANREKILACESDRELYETFAALI